MFKRRCGLKKELNVFRSQHYWGGQQRNNLLYMQVEISREMNNRIVKK